MTRASRGSAAVLAALVVLGAWTTATPVEAGVAVPAGNDLLVIHDSVVINARGTIRHKLDGWNIEYLGFHGMQAAMANAFLDRRRAPIPDTVLVALNFNDRDREQIRADFRGLLRRLAPARRIVWVLPGVHGPHMIPVRETMLEVVAEDRRVEVTDWQDHYRKSDALTDLFGVHLTRWGTWVYATMLDRVLDRAPVGDPPSIGDLGQVRSTARGEEAIGWALDLESIDAVRVDVYVDGERRRRVSADRDRPAVDAAHGLGPAHGFRARFGLDDGQHRVCALTTPNNGRGAQSLGCTALTVRHDSIGRLGPLRRQHAGVVARGWAYDPDQPEPIPVHIYVDGAFAAAAPADLERYDVAALHPGRTHNGFEVTLADVDAGDEVCVYAIDRRRGRNRLLGCRTA